MSLIPCQLQPQQIGPLCNTMLGTFPARPIITGRTCIDLLIFPLRRSPPKHFELDPAACSIAFEMPDGRGGHQRFDEQCPAGVPGNQLWLQEPVRIVEVFPGKAVRVQYQDDQRLRTIYLSGGEPEYRVGMELLTPRIEWARAERLLVRSVDARRLCDVTEEDAARAGASAVAQMAGHRGLGRSHLRGLQMWWDTWHGLGKWVDQQQHLCWLVWFERGFDDPQ